jgi:uncharacterized repeat protein (TIGR04076 family)
MAICEITVLDKLYNADLADAYRRPDVHQGPCPYYTEGQEFVIKNLGERPPDFFCDWAWNDLYKFILVMMTGGDFGAWMQDGNTFIACCTDGIKPVIFRLQRLEEG